tara:strand:+ start:1275 stop:2198 length:924 start_codon:yes stop_codon:yes gene_type:complete
MKYIIITIVIAAIIAILSQFLGIANSKNDKLFLTTVSIILILSGLYFSYKSESLKDKETSEQGAKLDTTLTNTENLKQTTQEIVGNLEQSLGNLKNISTNIDTLTTVLGAVESDLQNQITTVKNTLSKAEEFEKAVNKQLKLAEEQFALDKPVINAYVEGLIPESQDSSKVNIAYYYKNSGNRIATKIEEHHIVLFHNKERGIFYRIKKIGESSDIIDYPANGGGSRIVFNTKIDKEILGKEVENLILVVAIQYSDIATNEVYNKTFTAYANNLTSGDYTFNYASPSFIAIAKKYLQENNFDNFYLD